METFNTNSTWSPFSSGDPGQQIETIAKDAMKLPDKQFQKAVQKIAREEPKDKAEVEKTQGMVLKLFSYGNSARFKSYLQSLGFNLTPGNLKKLTYAELDEMYVRVQTSIANRSNSSFLTAGFFYCTNTAENIISAKVPKERFCLDGWTTVLQQNEELLDALHQVELEHGNLVSLSPEKRILLCLASSAMQVNFMNQSSVRLKKALEKRQGAPEEAPQEIVQEPLQESASDDGESGAEPSPAHFVNSAPMMDLPVLQM